MSLFTELKRRNVLRVGAAYIVSAWLVIQVVETLFPIYGLTDGALRLVVNVLAAGLIPILVLSWIFELTPDGLKKDAEVDHDRGFATDSAKRLDRIILAVLALALGYFAFDKFVLSESREAAIAEQARQEGRSEAIIESRGDASIAVLAFADMSPDKDQEYLSDGIAEEILHLLAEIPQLRVISRSSAFSFKGKNTPIPEIARQLHVAYILEGSVRKSGDRIRVTAQLIEAGSDTHIWSETWDRTLVDIFAIQDELAAAMVEQLELSLLGEAPNVAKTSQQAYELYLRAKHFLNAGSVTGASELLEQAVALDPEFVPAWADLTTSFVFSAPTMGQSDHTGDPVFPKLIAAINRLIELSPEHPLILTYGAWETIETSANYHAAAQMLGIAVEEYPNNTEVLRSASFLAMLFDQQDLAVRIATRLVRVDPLCSRCQMHFYRVLMSAGLFGQAQETLARFVDLRPDMAHTYEVGIVRLMTGDIDGARAIFEGHADPMVGDWGELLIQAQVGARRVEREELNRLDESMTSFNPRWMAELYAMAGFPEDAFRKLREAAQRTANWRFVAILRTPLLAGLHEHEPWNEMLEIAGVSPAQLSDIDFNPELKWENFASGEISGQQKTQGKAPE